MLLTIGDEEQEVQQEVRATIIDYLKRPGGYDEFELLVGVDEETQFFSFRKNNDQDTSMFLTGAEGNTARVVQTYSITQRSILPGENQADLDARIDEIVKKLGERQRDAVLEGHRQRPCYMSINN